MDNGAVSTVDESAGGGSAIPVVNHMPIEDLLGDNSVLGDVIRELVLASRATAESYAAHSTSM